MALESYPGTIEATHTGRPPDRYRRDPTTAALPGHIARELDLEELFRLPGAGLVVVPVGPRLPPAAVDEAIAVYRHETGALSVPTGRLFVQFDESERADARAAGLRSAGFEIEQVPGYARHAAWVRPASGNAAEGLREIEELRRLDGVVAVEPEMLAPMGRR